MVRAYRYHECNICGRSFRTLGYARHRAAHLDASSLYYTNSLELGKFINSVIQRGDFVRFRKGLVFGRWVNVEAYTDQGGESMKFEWKKKPRPKAKEKTDGKQMR